MTVPGTKIYMGISLASAELSRKFEMAATARRLAIAFSALFVSFGLHVGEKSQNGSASLANSGQILRRAV